MSSQSARAAALEAIEAVVFPDGWTMDEPDTYFRFLRIWWRENQRDPSGQRNLSMVRLSAQAARGAVEVTGFAMTIVCGGAQVQAAVDAVLAWEKASNEAVARHEAGQAQDEG